MRAREGGRGGGREGGREGDRKGEEVGGRERSNGGNERERVRQQGKYKELTKYSALFLTSHPQ